MNRARPRPLTAQATVHARVLGIRAIGLCSIVAFTVLAWFDKGGAAERVALLGIATGCATSMGGAPRNEPPAGEPSPGDRMLTDLLKGD